MHEVDTIAAIATPLGVGGIGVVRVSGPAAGSIAQRVFVRPSGLPLTHLESRRVYYGFVVDGQGERVDEALLCLMRRPHSYTCEDVTEISCHGGVLTTQRVLETVLAQGARVAEPGEFTKRAFLNGRLDLTQAEAVIDVINARTLASHRAALQQLDGALSRHLRELREDLLQVSVYLEAGIDFPEEDLELVPLGELSERLAAVATQLTRVLGTFARGRALREGLATLRIIDTAGIRATTDAVEQEGVRRARDAIERAELLLVVFDGSTALTVDDHLVLTATAGKPRVLVRNKSDLPTCWVPEALGATGAPCLDISALRGDGLVALERALVQQALGHTPLGQDEVLLTQERHRRSLAIALRNVQTAEQGLRQGVPLEFVAFDVTEAIQQIAEVLGESCTGEVLDRIFSSFCIGK